MFAISFPTPAVASMLSRKNCFHTTKRHFKDFESVAKFRIFCHILWCSRSDSSDLEETNQTRMATLKETQVQNKQNPLYEMLDLPQSNNYVCHHCFLH